MRARVASSAPSTYSSSVTDVVEIDDLDAGGTRRAVEALELETAPRDASRHGASASMKKFTVEPVPTPRTVPSLT